MLQYNQIMLPNKRYPTIYNSNDHVNNKKMCKIVVYMSSSAQYCYNFYLKKYTLHDKAELKARTQVSFHHSVYFKYLVEQSTNIPHSTSSNYLLQVNQQSQAVVRHYVAPLNTLPLLFHKGLLSWVWNSAQNHLYAY